jgi:hypothetical protein
VFSDSIRDNLFARRGEKRKKYGSKHKNNNNSRSKGKLKN